jgi:hypothetical protein
VFAYDRKTGKRIVATLDVLRGAAGVHNDSFSKDDNGDLVFDHSGGTDIWWNDAKTDSDENGNRFFVDEDDWVVCESDVELRES